VTPSSPPTTATHRSGTPAKVWLGLFIAVILDGPAQLMWKALMLKYGGASHGVDPISIVHWFLQQPRFWAMIACFTVQFVNWMWVLSNTDLSFAQPFTALSYVAVSGCAAFYFHEHIGPLRIVGIGLVLIGVFFVASSPHRTTRPEGEI
jgi:drug/metabolite transporter (DMT)-like permease